MALGEQLGAARGFKAPGFGVEGSVSLQETGSDQVSAASDTKEPHHCACHSN